MCSPSGVRNASVRIKDFGQVWLFLVDELFELCNLPYFLECEHLILLVPIDSKARRVLHTNQLADVEHRRHVTSKPNAPTAR